MPKQSKPNRVITPKPAWVIVRKRTGELQENTFSNSGELGWPHIWLAKALAEIELASLGPGWMIRKVVPRLEVLDHA